MSTAIAVGLVMPWMGYLIAARTIDHCFAVLSLPLLWCGAYFIVSVGMPDIESDRLAGRTNLLVSHGMRPETTVALLSTAMAFVLPLSIAYAGSLGAAVNIWPVALFSLVPLSMAGYSAVRDLGQPSQVLSQVKLNLVGIMSNLVVFVLTFGAAL